MLPAKTAVGIACRQYNVIFISQVLVSVHSISDHQLVMHYRLYGLEMHDFLAPQSLANESNERHDKTSKLSTIACM